MSGRYVALVVTLVLIVPAAAQAEPAHVEAPLSASEAELDTEAGQLLLEQGNGSLASSARSGSLVVWEERTPCFDRNPQSCFDDRSRTSRSSESLDGATLTLTPRSEGHRTAVGLEDGQASIGADVAELLIRPEAQTVTLEDDGDAPEDISHVEMPRGVQVHAGEADVTLEGQLVLQTTSSTLRVETNTSDEVQEIVTGVTWEQADDGFTYRTLRLVKASFAGGLTSPWDGALRATPQLPATLNAGSAKVNVTNGELGPANETTGPMQLEDLEATITGIEWRDDEPRFLVQHGEQAAPVAEDAEKSTVSRTTVIGAGSAAAAAALLAAYYWPRLSWLGTVVVLPLYSRIEKDELFENDTREALYASIKDDPGIHAHALSEAVDIGWGTTVYHLRRLERNGFVHSDKRGRYRRFFPASGFVERQREALSVLQNETTEDIATLVRERPGLNQSAICEELDISPSLANWHLNRLIDAELVDRERRGRTVHYSPGEAWETLEQAADVEAAEVPGDARAA